MKQTTVFLTEKEAALFLDFQRHHDIFEKLASTGAFDIQFGKATLNFAFGELQNIVKEEVVYKRPISTP